MTNILCVTELTGCTLILDSFLFCCLFRNGSSLAFACGCDAIKLALVFHLLGKLHTGVEGRSSHVCGLVYELICWLGRFCVKPLSACVKSMSFPSNNWKMSSAWPLILHCPPPGLPLRRRTVSEKGWEMNLHTQAQALGFPGAESKKYVVREKSTWRSGHRYRDCYWASSVYNTFQVEKDDSNSSPAGDFFHELG